MRTRVSFRIGTESTHSDDEECHDIISTTAPKTSKFELNQTHQVVRILVSLLEYGTTLVQMKSLKSPLTGDKWPWAQKRSFMSFADSDTKRTGLLNTIMEGEFC
ncbi:hypothetical protein JTB14_035242 [Gonioctena quinquepunctata]|nr:hypothetical protein JTB14_035242 [Gonioctena quinquepunctata]